MNATPQMINQIRTEMLQKNTVCNRGRLNLWQTINVGMDVARVSQSQRKVSDTSNSMSGLMREMEYFDRF